jgi:tetratricopeptide (TPR) repeat protein
MALREGNYAEAASRFEQALKDDPTRLDALAGLGMARYKLGAYDQAVDVLGPVVSQAPRHAEAQLYLGLSYLQKGDDRLAAEHLTAFRDVDHTSHLVRQIDEALKLIRSDQPLSTDIRRFIATSLENAAKAEREVREAARRAYAPPPLYGPPSFFGFLDCVPTRHGRMVCL